MPRCSGWPRRYSPWGLACWDLLRRLAAGVVQLCGDVPRQQFVDAVDRMLGDPFEHMPQIQVRVDVVEACSGDQSVDIRCPFAASVGAGEQIVAPPQDQRPNCAFGGVVVCLLYTSPSPRDGLL